MIKRLVVVLLAAFALPATAAQAETTLRMQLSTVGAGTLSHGAGTCTFGDLGDHECGTYTFVAEKMISRQLEAKPAPGWTFDGWEGCTHVQDVICIAEAPGGQSADLKLVARFADRLAPKIIGLTAMPSPTNEGHFTLNWDVSEPGVQFRCTLDRSSLSQCASGQGVTVGDGRHSFTVRALDASGNKGAAVEAVLDVVGTEITAGPAEGSSVASASSAFAASAVLGTAFECALDNATAFTPCGTAGEDGRGPIQVPAVTDGAHELRVRARLDSTVDRSPAVRHWTVDTNAPDTSIDAGFALGSDEHGVTFRCRIDDAPFAVCTSPVALPELAPGKHTLEAVAVDGAGNVDPIPARETWTIAALAAPVAEQAAPATPAEPAVPAATPAPAVAPLAIAAAVPPLALQFSFRRGRFTRLAATNVPAGSKLVVTVKGKRTTFARLIGRKLANGTKITVRAGTQTRTLTIKRGRAAVS